MATQASPYRMARVRRAYVDVIGGIWMPYGATCAYRYELRDYDLENIGEFTRENVDRWLTTNSGDFSSIKDFRAECGETEIPWADEESELTYNDCMYPAED